MLDQTTVVAPRETTAEDLLVVHTQSYLDSLRVSYKSCTHLQYMVLCCEKLEMRINLCSTMYTFLILVLALFLVTKSSYAVLYHLLLCGLCL